MEIKLDSELFARNGRCGTIRHIVVDPGTNTVRSLVVDTSSEAGTVVIPIERVVQMAGRLVVMGTREEVGAMSRFVSVCHQIWPVVPAALEGEQRSDPLRVEHVAMAPGDLAVDKGTSIKCQDGDCGSLEEILADPDSERISAVLVRRGMLFTSPLLIPASWIDHVAEGAIHLRATCDQVEKLARSVDKGEWGPPGTARGREPESESVYPDIEPPGGGLA